MDRMDGGVLVEFSVEGRRGRRSSGKGLKKNWKAGGGKYKQLSVDQIEPN
jgi:hypothetical protein